MNKKPILTAVLVWVVAAGLVAGVAAQSGDEGWVVPFNLSRSGAASDPLVVVDNEGIYHVLWQDSFDGFVYTRGTGTEWDSPAVVELPFGTRLYYPELRENQPTPFFAPRLVPTAAGRIFAFWGDTEGLLFSSSVPAGLFGSLDAWRERVVLADSVLSFDATAGPDGTLHLVTVRTAHTPTFPAGVYYRRSDDGGFSWSPSVPLYQTIYFRLLEVGAVHLAIAGDDRGGVRAAWDDPRLEKVFYARSADGGLTWAAPQELVARPDEEPEGTEFVATLAGLVSTAPGTELLFWAASDGDTCSLNYRVSADGGLSWETSQPAPVDGCGPVTRVGEAPLVIQIARDESDQLAAWYNGVWATPLTLAATFLDPDSGRSAELESVQAVYPAGGPLLLVGRDRRGGDVWALRQRVPVPASEILPAPTEAAPPAWTAPVRVSGGTVDAREPALAADDEGRFHLVWSQPGQGAPEGPGRELLYARWDGLQWSRAATLFALAGETAEHPAMAVDAQGLLHLVWSSGEAGEIAYSRVESQQAAATENWADPVALPMPHLIGSWPVVAVGRDGLVHVVYAIPLNEGRGIYYTRSDDSGRNWTAPSIVFDAVSEGWAQVDHPTLAVGGDGRLHVAWVRQPLSGSLLAGGVYYAWSDDRGKNWSVPLRLAESGGDWPQLAAVGELEVHLFWGETAGRQSRLHRRSIDGGREWSVPSSIPGVQGGYGPVGIAVDGAGRPHLAAIGPGDGKLLHWMWEGERWVEMEGGAPVLVEAPGETSAFAAMAIASGDGIGLAFQLPGPVGEPGAVYFVARSLALPDARPTPLPTLTPTPVATPEPTATAEPAPTPTPSLAGGRDPGVKIVGITLPGNWAGMLLGAIPAGLIVLVAFIIGVRAVQGGRR